MNLTVDGSPYRVTHFGRPNLAALLSDETEAPIINHPRPSAALAPVDIASANQAGPLVKT